MSDVSEGLRLFITNTAPRCRLEVGGEIDLATIGALRDHLALLVESATGDVDVDMAGVVFCDATVLRVLLAARQTLDADGRHIQIINPSAPTARLLQLTGLDTTLLATPHREPQDAKRPCGLSRTPPRADGRRQDGAA
jgi:anti-sigma B factor antagonist